MDPIPYATPVARAPLERDRRGWLIAFGVLSVLLGMPPTLVAAFVAYGVARMVTYGIGRVGVLPNVVAYLAAVALVNGALGTLLIWTGVASIRCRRWARPVVVGVGVPTAVTSALAVSGFLQMSRDLRVMNATPNPPDVSDVVMPLLFMTVFGVVLPGVYVWFYSSDSVRRTLEAYDPQPSWTERSPLPVFVGCVTLFFAGLATGALAVGRSAPFFGEYVHGLVGGVLCVAAGVAMIVSAWLMYRGLIAGWWMAVIVVVGGFVSAIVTLCRLGVLVFYREGGISLADVSALGRSPTMSGVTPIVYVAIVMAISVGYLLWIRRHYRMRDAAPVGA